MLQFLRLFGLAFAAKLPLPLVCILQFMGGGAYALVYSIITEQVGSHYMGKVRYSAQTMKLVVMRGVGVSVGSALLGAFYAAGMLKTIFASLAVVAALFAGVLCVSSTYRKLSQSAQFKT